MTTTTETTPTPAPAPAWRDGKRYMWAAAIVVPLLPFIAFGIWTRSGYEVFWWLTPGLVFVLIPILDAYIGDDGGNPPAELVQALQDDRFYRWMTYLYLPLQYGAVVLGCWVWTTGNLGWLGMAGLVVTLGTVNGIAINTAHELGHKKEETEQRLSKIALAPSMYGHFFVEHNRGHHTRVATPEDPASARVGQSFYAFLPRTVLGSLRSAVRLEWRKWTNREQNPWTWRNDVLNAWFLTVVLFGVLVAFYGWSVLPFLVLQGALGFSLLEIVNYLEHYGLKRGKNEAGRYEKVDPRHSWNSNRLATNLFLYQLQRHSDHHANPTLRYQVLRHFDTSPQLPAGYATMIVLALFPPLWRRVMDPRVVAHYDGDISLANLQPRKRDRIVARWGTAA